MADIFLSLNDEQHGPYEAEQLESWLRDGSLAPETLAWQEGMDQWQPLAAFFPHAVPVAPEPEYSPPPLPAPRPAAAAPRPRRAAAPVARSQVMVPRPRMHQPYATPGSWAPVPPEGFNRVQYFLTLLLTALLFVGVVMLVGMFVFGALAGGALRQEDKEHLLLLYLAAFWGAALLWLGINFWVGIKRLQNIGWSAWFVLLLPVPVIGSLFVMALQALPPRFAQHLKMDGAAWAWIGFWVLLVIVFVVLMVLGVLQAVTVTPMGNLQQGTGHG